MLKDILKIRGIQKLDKNQQLNIRGGDEITGGIHKCCIKVPGQPNGGGCNKNASCIGKPCGCS